MSIGAAAMFTLIGISSGCGGGGGSSVDTKSAVNLPPAVAAAVRSSTPPPPVIVNANNTLGFQLLKQMRTTDTGKNVFISPVSIALCMEILYNGAAGSTQAAMAQALDLGTLSTTDLNNDNADLQASLVSSDPAVQLNVANSFWYHKANNQILAVVCKHKHTVLLASDIGDLLTGAPNNVNALGIRCTDQWQDNPGCWRRGSKICCHDGECGVLQRGVDKSIRHRANGSCCLYARRWRYHGSLQPYEPDHSASLL